MADENKIPIFNSEEFAEKVADKVYNKTAGTFTDFMLNIENGLKGIADDISDIKDRLTTNENKVTIEEQKIKDIDDRLKWKKNKINEHEDRLNNGKKLIEEIRNDLEQFKEDTKELAEIKPTLKTIQKVFEFWKLKNWLKITGIVIGIILIFSAMVIGIYSYMRKSGWVTEYSNKHSQNFEQYDEGMKILNAPVRSVLVQKLTDAQIDSNQAAILRYNIKPIKGMNNDN